MEGNRSSASPSKKRKAPKSNAVKDEEQIITVKIDPQLLHCTICPDPLHTDGRLFQCVNGHVICSACAAKHGDTCPDCLAADVTRCLALENLVDGLRLPCPFSNLGCPEFLSRADKPSHESRCPHAPSPCLVPGCHWSGPRDRISDHVRVDHARSCGFQGFFYNKRFSIQVGWDGPMYLLRGKDGSVFALLVTNPLPAGMMLRVVRIQRGSAVEAMFEYDLEVRRGRSSMTLKSVVHDEWEKQQQESMPEVLFVPRHFAGGAAISVDLRIRKF